MQEIISRISELLDHANKPVVVTVGGPSGGGKTTIVKQITRHFPRSSTVHTDDYYHGKAWMQANLSPTDAMNYDLPAAIDMARLVTDLKALVARQTVHAPHYDMLTSEPYSTTQAIHSAPLIIVEGIAANLPELAPVRDLSVTVTAPLEVRLERRALRDRSRKNYSDETTSRYMLEVAEPAYRQYYLPYDMRADCVLASSSN